MLRASSMHPGGMELTSGPHSLTDTGPWLWSTLAVGGGAPCQLAGSHIGLQMHRQQQRGAQLECIKRSSWQVWTGQLFPPT